MMRFNYVFVCGVTLIATQIFIETEGDDTDIMTSNKSRALWPISCFVYGIPVSDDPESTTLNATENNDFSDVKFVLFSRDTSVADQILITDNVMSVIASKFSSVLPTKIIVHGWRDNASNEMMQVIKRAYFSRVELNNVIGVDWGKYAASLNYLVVAEEYVPKVGLVLAKFIEFLVKKFIIPLSSVQIMGHSLGAQVCGYAGQFLIEFGVGRLPVIMGLDPALPLFQKTSPVKHLDASDADYVEIIHTASSCKGMDVQVGTADFYPNFNRWRHKQPGCGIDPAWACSHARAYYYFAESLIKEGGFVSVRCKSFDELKDEKCSSSEGVARLGGYLLEKKDASGIYYLKTNEKSPFSLT